jgi:hypothetical protein
MVNKLWLFGPLFCAACTFPPENALNKTSSDAQSSCIPVAHIDEWRAYDDDTLSLFQKGREIARVDIHTSGMSDTWIMHAIHVVRYEAGNDGLLCRHGSDALVLDGRRHFIEHIQVLKSTPHIRK